MHSDYCRKRMLRMLATTYSWRPLWPIFGYCRTDSASSAFHGATCSIYAKKISHRVFLRLPVPYTSPKFTCIVVICRT